MLHSALIAGHTAGGLAAFALGILLLLKPECSGASRVFQWYLASLWAMVLLLAAVVLWDWKTLASGARTGFGALTLLAIYMGWRGVQARRHRQQYNADRFIDDVGFTVIGLFDGFAIVTALDLQSPVWATALVGAAGVVIGSLALTYIKKQNQQIMKRSG